MFKEYNQLNLTKIHEETLDSWEVKSIFKNSIDFRNDNKDFTFYEGPLRLMVSQEFIMLLHELLKIYFVDIKPLKVLK